MLAIALKALSIGKGLFAPLASLWRYLAADWHRMAFAVLIALCGFLCWRLWSVDVDRDDWRDLAQQYEAASQIVEDADAAADAEALDVASDMKGTVDAENERAKAAAADSPDPLRDGLDSLRSEGDRRSD